MVNGLYNFFEISDMENVPEGHGAIFGKTGSGKTSLLHLIVRKLSSIDKTVIILDPHGDLVKNLLIMDKTIFISPLFRTLNGRRMAIRMNLMEIDELDEMRINAVTETLKMLFSMDQDYSQGTWGPRLETVFSTVVPDVLKNKTNATLIDIERSLMNRDFVGSDYLRSMYGRNYYEYIQSTMNKLSPITGNIFLREFLCSREVTFSLLKNNIDRRVVGFYLAKPELGEFISRMAGSAVLSMILNAVIFKRIKDATIIIDEIKDFSPYLLPGLFSESRKHNLRIIIAAQYVNQLSRDLYDSIMGNVSWIASFRVSPEDSHRISRKFSFENSRIENTLINLPDHYALLRDDEIRLYRIKDIIRYSDEEIIDKSYIEYGAEVNDLSDDILSLIYSMQEMNRETNFDALYREYSHITGRNMFSMDQKLRVLQLNSLIIRENGRFRITEKGLALINEYDRNPWETWYHRYLVTRTSEYFKSLGFQVSLSRQWRNEPDIIARGNGMEIYIEAEYGDMKSPGKIVNHLIQWKNKKLMFVTFENFSLKLFRILCMPALVNDSGEITFYRNGRDPVDYRLAGDYSKRVWIGVVPYPGSLGPVLKFNTNGNRMLVIDDLYESDLFIINNRNILETFGKDLFVWKDGKIIKRCDLFFNEG
ncbi:MAG: helicase HerA domain-containing protein [Thermoplasmata archaeon]